ncbi:hypothetical protein HAX54_015924, partial [Datura stramonium]|nr:hypothetical protein [Datura stramonium]
RAMEIETRSINVIGMVKRVEQFEDEIYFLNDERKLEVRMDMMMPICRTVTTTLEGVQCCGDNIAWGCKTLDTRYERVDEQNMEQGYSVVWSSVQASSREDLPVDICKTHTGFYDPQLQCTP